MTKIVVDPGHYGGYNTGVCKGYYEGNTMLKLGNYLADALKNKGADVTMTRSTDEENPTLAARGSMVPGADLFISLHTDASDDASARGVTVYNSIKRPDSEPLANEIGVEVANVMGNEFRGTVARPSSDNPELDYLGVLRSAVSSNVKNAMLVENGFHTNQEDCAVLSRDDQLKNMANAMAGVIGNYFELSSEQDASGFQYTVKPGDTLFQIGRRVGVPWKTLAETNNIMSPYILQTGEVLWIPQY